MASTRTLRAQIRLQTVGVVALALALFAVPLGIAAQELMRSRTVTALQRDATRALATVPDNLVETGTAVRLPAASPGTRLGLYTTSGRRASGAGPARSALSAATRDGHEHDGTDHGDVAVAVPVVSDRTVVGSIRAGRPMSSLRGDALTAWALLAGLAVGVVGVALFVAGRGARRLARPFEQVQEVAVRLRDGEVIDRVPSVGVTEADSALAALAESSRQVTTLLASERDFVKHASHQLRTPLAALQLQLTQEPPDLAGATDRAQHLVDTVADLVALRARAWDHRCRPAPVVRAVARRWGNGTDTVRLRVDDTDDIACSAAVLRQCLDVLLDNARRHGRGAVTVTLEQYGDRITVEVADQGAGLSPNTVRGTGLSLVEALMDRCGGELLVRHHGSTSGVAVVVPAVPAVTQPGSASKQ